MRIIFVTKVTGVDKTTIVANDTTFLRQYVFVFRILSQSTGLKFLIWTEDKIRPGNRVSLFNRAHMKRPWGLSVSWRHSRASLLLHTSRVQSIIQTLSCYISTANFNIFIRGRGLIIVVYLAILGGNYKHNHRIIFNNYSPQAQWWLLNNPHDEVAWII